MNIFQRLYGGMVTGRATSTISLYQFLAGYPELSADFQIYAGKVLLIVNTASRCGFTSQYDALEELYAERVSRGFVVLGFPSNDFMGQEPGTDAEIDSFCRANYGVTFKLFPKASVRGENTQPVFKFLAECGPPELRGDVRWNFEKFLLDREGYLVGRWRSYVSPHSRSVVRAVDSLLPPFATGRLS